MKFLYLTIFVIFQTRALDVEVEGELSFKMKSRNQRHKKHTKNNEMDQIQIPRSRVTAGPMVECVYQYPEDAQVQAILSEILNELTKVFVRAEELMNEDYRRKGGTRFRVVTKKNTDFFDRIYTNMTGEYLSQYNSSTDHVVRSGQTLDACKHQEEIKQLWKDLLDNAFSTFRRAASDCIEEHLQAVNRASDEKLRGRLSQFLLKELSKVRNNQLDMLCDSFQLCYNELL